MEKVYHKPTQSVYDLTQELKQKIKDKGSVDEYAKILALPEHFSDKHLQAIVDGKMEEGKVLVKCFRYDSWTGSSIKYFHRIKLNQQNHITLFPVKQSLEEAAEKYGLCGDHSNEDPQYAAEQGFKAGAKWAKKNNY